MREPMEGRKWDEKEGSSKIEWEREVKKEIGKEGR